MPFTSRPYRGHGDLRLIIELGRQITAARRPSLPRWHAGDLVWVLYAREPGDDDVRLWFAGDRLAGVAFLAPELYVETAPGPAGDRATIEAFDWAEERARRGVSSDAPEKLTTFSLDSDARRNRMLLDRAWRRTDRGGFRMARRLDLPVQSVSLPEGMRVRDCTDIDVEERAAAHRDAWSHLDEIGMPGVRSGFSADLYRRLRSTPGYDPLLDLAVEAKDGAIAACCICWADDPNGIGVFEPVGTRFAYRRLGLARAMIFEGLSRLQQRGIHTALIGTARFNHPAKAAYLSCGFNIVDTDSAYELDLRAS